MEDMDVLGTTLNKMPEFPEVKTVISILKDNVLGKSISKIDILRAKNFEGDSNKLIGATIKDISQVGKFIVFHFDNPYVLVSHLRMEGKYFFRHINDPYNKHDIAAFIFEDNSTLVYNDVRKFGILQIRDASNYLEVEPLASVGPNPFEMKDASRLEKSFKNKSIPIKTALLDQSIMSGLGNIYVDEVLFECKIHPETPAKLISRDQLEQVLKASQIILQKAIEKGGSTIKSYHPKEGVSGEFQVDLKVYGKKDGSCVRCGHHLRKIFVGGRGTTYCPKCQKNPALPKVVAVTGPVGSGKSTVSKLFENRGYLYLDSDKIVHELYKEKEVQVSLKKFIPNLKIVNGDIDRESLKEDLLNNPKHKVRLEKYIHSLVSERIVSSIKSSKQNVVMEVPLLFESHLDDFADEIIYVEASKDKQITRLKNRDKDYEQKLELNKNFNKENKEKATLVIINDKDVASLEKIIDAFCDK